MNHYRITHLAGAARSGSDKTGHITHVVIGERALCGKKPGRHSAGWSEYNDRAITCPYCATIFALADDLAVVSNEAEEIE